MNGLWPGLYDSEAPAYEAPVPCPGHENTSRLLPMRCCGLGMAAANTINDQPHHAPEWANTYTGYQVEQGALTQDNLPVPSPLERPLKVRTRGNLINTYRNVKPCHFFPASITGSPAFFHAFMPPSTLVAFLNPSRSRIPTAMPERYPDRQINTTGSFGSSRPD